MSSRPDKPENNITRAYTTQHFSVSGESRAKTQVFALLCAHTSLISLIGHL